MEHFNEVVMATNRADTVDPGLLLPGRLDRKIEFPLPNRHQKRLLFEDTGGCDIQTREIREALELPLTHHELYQEIGINPPRPCGGVTPWSAWNWNWESLACLGCC
ncbi:UNVERIFIED_CONTAM: 26S proteasome regulatory subunitB [Sesamum radiatum]|uniref:26S proteasome regulatory subunitB n=1 Tax=Sesamum radiatum TaxID=300843 RepID=A0AAW2J8T0_SESRA